MQKVELGRHDENLLQILTKVWTVERTSDVGACSQKKKEVRHTAGIN